MSERHHVCVCICTYKRFRYLHRLLTELERQETEDLFDYAIVVVDNDRLASAKQVVESFAQQSRVAVTYSVQPEQNIALTRNKAVENAEGDLVAFIDDDELPDQYWLLELYKAILTYQVDGILGPVLPDYEKKPPGWVLKGRFFDRPTHPSGHVLEWDSTRTGNVLLKRKLFETDRQWFDPNYGSGGEDRDFFRRRIADGAVFVWCNEALVYETVPSDRWKRTIMLKRALLRGRVAFENSSAKTTASLRSLFAVVMYAVGLPFFLVSGQHVFMTYLIKIFDHLGKVLAALGLDVVKEKYVTTG